MTENRENKELPFWESSGFVHGPRHEAPELCPTSYIIIGYIGYCRTITSIHQNPLFIVKCQLHKPEASILILQKALASINMLPRTARSLLRSSASSSLRLLPYQRQPSHQLLKLSQPAISRRRFHVSLQTRKGVLPDSSDPEPPKPEPHFVEHAIHINEPAPISGEEYHEIADEYIDELVMKLEEMIESGEQQYEVEYSVRHLLSEHPKSSPLTMIILIFAGRCNDAQHTSRHLRAEQTAAEQADLDLVTCIGAEEV